MLKIVVFLLLALLILKLEFIIKLELNLDVYKRDCVIRLYIFHVKIFGARLLYEPAETGIGNITLKIGKKEFEIKIFNDETGDNDSISVARIRQVLSNLMIMELGIDAKIGGKNALNVTMLTASTRIAYYSLISFVKSRQNLKIYERFTPLYNEQVFTVDIYGILNISIADIIFSLLTSGLDRIRHGRLRINTQLEK